MPMRVRSVNHVAFSNGKGYDPADSSDQDHHGEAARQCSAVQEDNVEKLLRWVLPYGYTQR